MGDNNMARKKTTKKALDMVNYFNESLEHFEEVLRIKQLPLEQQANYIKEKSVEYYEGWITGIQVATEHVLHKDNCYFGFHYVDSKGGWITSSDTGQEVWEHEDYKPYRINYFTKK